jgi:hypothetical protein
MKKTLFILVLTLISFCGLQSFAQETNLNKLKKKVDSLETRVDSTSRYYMQKSDSTRFLRSYKYYLATISQDSTLAPTVTVFENNIGTIVWTRDSVGMYTGTLSSAFTVDKTLFIPLVSNLSVTLELGTTSTIRVYSFLLTAYADEILNKFPFEIRVYP